MVTFIENIPAQGKRIKLSGYCVKHMGKLTYIYIYFQQSGNPLVELETGSYTLQFTSTVVQEIFGVGIFSYTQKCIKIKHFLQQIHKGRKNFMVYLGTLKVLFTRPRLQLIYQNLVWEQEHTQDKHEQYQVGQVS